MLASKTLTEAVNKGNPILRAKRFWRFIDSSIFALRSGRNMLGPARPSDFSHGRRMVQSMPPQISRAIHLASALNLLTYRVIRRVGINWQCGRVGPGVV